MEVLGISVVFITVAAGAVAFSASLLGRALARDRAYLLATGELQLPAMVAEEEVPWPDVPVDPVGTLALLLVYLMVLIGLWLSMFAILLARS